MNLKKRGQAANGADAAILIAIITGLIILYIIFLPVGDREELLGIDLGGSTGTSSRTTGTIDYTDSLVLLSAHPGSIDYIYRDRVEHNVPSTHLITRTEGGIIDERAAMYVKNALFSKLTENLTFEVKNIENTENILLNFQVKSHTGRLVIKLNGNLIFNEEIITRDIEPIKLNKKYLADKNVLEFEAESPSFAFWRINEYVLKAVTITGDVTDISGRTSEDVFIIDEDEKENMKNSAKLRMFPECVTNKVGKIYVSLNKQLIYSGIPDCGSYFTKEFLADRLRAGENTIEFEADDGSYFLDRIYIMTYLKKTRDFIYDFDIKDEVFNDLVDDNVDAYLIVEFPDNEYKEAELSINGHLAHLSTEDTIYVRKISDLITNEGNFIKITPQKSMYVSKLSIEIMTDEYYDENFS